TGGKGCGIEAHRNGCITQSTSRQDLIAGGCNGTGPGHLNWQPVTYTTHNLRWDGWSNGFDGDYNFRLGSTDGFGGPEIVDIDGGGETSDVPLEFNYSETVRDFDTEWWRSFRAAVCASSGLLDKCTVTTVTGSEAWCAGDFTKGPCAMVPGRDGIAIGLLGLDLEHGGVAEHHPIYALAINTYEGVAPGGGLLQKWALFFRNAGNEGFCSDSHLPLTLPDNTLRLTLPWFDRLGSANGDDVIVERSD